MAYININTQILEDVAKEVEQYVSLIDCNIRLSQHEVDNLLDRWNGPDADMFNLKWKESIKENDSSVQCLKESLTSFYKYLRYCKVHYEHEAEEAVNRSSRLYIL